MWSDDPAGFAQRHGLSAREVVWFQCTAEHLKARNAGGSSVLDNIAAACRRCNALRHRRASAPSWEEFRRMVRARIKQRRWYPRHLQSLVQGTAGA